MVRTLFLFLFLFIGLVNGQAPDPSDGNDKSELKPVQPGTPPYDERIKDPCDSEFRSFDGTCTNPSLPERQLWGSTNRPQFSYFGNRDTSTATGVGLKSARDLSNILFQSSMDVFDSRGLSEMATFFGQFIDHTITATPSSKDEMFIDISEDDPFFANKSKDGKAQIPFFRSLRVKVSESGPQERPSNSLTSAIDLDSVYGPSKKRQGRLAVGKDGLMKVSDGDLLPLNGKGRLNFNNAPPKTGPEFFLAGDHRSNEHPVLTSLHTIFLREHNKIAAQVKSELGITKDITIFQIARKIHIAQMQKIVFNSWYPAMTGRTLRKYKKFRKNVDPSISVVFSTAAFRVGHTMVGNEIKKKGPGNKNLPGVPFTEMFFNTAASFKAGEMEDFVRGALTTRAQKIDTEIRDSLRNFLFENVEKEEGFDLMAFNLQRGRDHALPTYNEIRQRFGMGRATSFKKVTKSKTVRSKLQTAYDTVDDIEAIVGLFAEDPAPGSSMGKTMLKIWDTEFRRLRDGDSFYYEQKDYFTAEEQGLPIVQEILSSADSFKAMVLRNTKVTDAEYPSKSFFAN